MCKKILIFVTSRYCNLKQIIMKLIKKDTDNKVETEGRKSKIRLYWESKPNEGVIHNMRAVLR